MEPVCDFSRYSPVVVQYDMEQYSGAIPSFTKYLSCFILSRAAVVYVFMLLDELSA